MCGFAGFLSTNSCKEDVLFQMGNSIRHRGPDDQGTWLDECSGIGLAHRRLSILDLSPAGHQPMHSPSGRYCIVFNGEIYYHLELRKELEEVSWHGHSDTETLLAGFDRFGVHEMVKRSIGMFGFAVWDKKNRELIQKKENFERDKKILSKSKDKKNFEQSKILTKHINDLTKEQESLQDNINILLHNIPNIPSVDVPVGKDEKSNNSATFARLSEVTTCSQLLPTHFLHCRDISDC